MESFDHPIPQGLTERRIEDTQFTHQLGPSFFVLHLFKNLISVYGLAELTLQKRAELTFCFRALSFP